MTDEHVVKALECCIKGECSKCPLSAMVCGDEVVMQYAVDLIKRQQVELDDLKRDSIPRLQDGLNRANKYGLEADKEIERQKQILNSYALQYGTVTDQSKKIKEIKDEAYEEFAERLLERKYESSDWSHGEHPYVVEESDIDEVLWKLTEGSK